MLVLPVDGSVKRMTKSWMLALNMRCPVRHTLKPSRIVCCKIAKLAGSISKERAGLLSVKFLSMANDVFFGRLPNGWGNGYKGISIPDHLENDLKWKNMWEQARSGKTHTILCSWNNCVTGWLVGIPRFWIVGCFNMLALNMSCPVSYTTLQPSRIVNLL